MCFNYTDVDCSELGPTIDSSFGWGKVERNCVVTLAAQPGCWPSNPVFTIVAEKGRGDQPAGWYHGTKPRDDHHSQQPILQNNIYHTNEIASFWSPVLATLLSTPLLVFLFFFSLPPSLPEPSCRSANKQSICSLIFRRGTRYHGLIRCVERQKTRPLTPTSTLTFSLIRLA